MFELRMPGAMAPWAAGYPTARAVWSAHDGYAPKGVRVLRSSDLSEVPRVDYIIPIVPESSGERRATE